MITTEQVDYFNTAPVKAFSTCDLKGNPNVSLCGTARLLKNGEIQLISGFYTDTLANIEKTGKAVFMAHKSTSKEYWQQFEQKGTLKYPPGYRFYCRYEGIRKDDAALTEIKARYGYLGNKILSRLNTLLIFQVEKVKIIDFGQ